MGGVGYVMNNKQLRPFNRQIENRQYHFSFILGKTAKFNSSQYMYFQLYSRTVLMPCDVYNALIDSNYRFHFLGTI